MTRSALSLGIVLTALVCLEGLAAAGPETLAVFATGEAADDAAREVTRALRDRADVLDEALATERLGDLARPPFDLTANEGAFRAATSGKLAPEAAIAQLEEVVASLERAVELDGAGYALLQSARLEAARRHLGLAGPKELGGAETEAGARARGLLIDVVRADPGFELDPARYPPKLRRLLQGAQDELRRRRRGSLSVSSAPEGATVLVEGRALGTTPLHLDQALPEGRYRVTVSGEGGRARSRFVDVGAAPVVLEVDLDLEVAVRPHRDGPRLASNLNGAQAEKLARRLDVEALVLVDIADGELRLSLHRGAAPARTASAPVGGDVARAADAAVASLFGDTPLAAGAAGSEAALEAEEGGGLGWALAGAGTGLVLTVAVTTVGLGALWLYDADVKSRSLKVEVTP